MNEHEMDETPGGAGMHLSACLRLRSAAGINTRIIFLSEEIADITKGAMSAPDENDTVISYY